MLIFGNDDNDDNLDLDFDGKQSKTPPIPPTSSLPTRPATRSPFGSNADQVENLVPEKKVGLPTRNPSSPFGQNNAGTKPRLPQNPLSDVKPAHAANEDIPVKKPQAPFSRVEEPVISPPAPSLSSYLPPSKISEPQVQPIPEIQAEPEVLSETEQYLRAMKEHAQEKAAEAKLAEAAQKIAAAAATPANTVGPSTISAPVIAPVPAPVHPEQQGKKKKKGFFAPPPKKDTKNREGKKSSPAKQARESQYAGERKKVLWIRLVAGSVAVIITVAGVQAIFAGDTGPSKSQVQAAAKEAVNYTGFPTTSGEQFSLDFAKAYFNYNSKDATRLETLGRFASKELVNQIDIQILSSAEYESVKKEGISYSNINITQTIAYGPYVVSSKNITAENAVFTVKVGLATDKVVYLDVPVKYDPKNYSMTLAGPPSFSKPIQNQGSVAKTDYTIDFEGSSDDALEKSLEGDLAAYLKAWAESDEVIVRSFTLPTATDNATKGLQKTVVFNKILDLKIQPFDADSPNTERGRRAEINVLWEDPKTGLRYPQQYRMLIGKNPEDKWTVQDIENFAVLNK